MPASASDVRFICAGPALALALLASAAASAEVGAQELRELSLEELLNVPIVAASVSEARPSDVPASAFVVTEETIRDRGYGTLLDLLEDLPQFEVQHKDTQTRRNVVSVRGLFGNERLVILYDGIRVTPPAGDLYAMSTQFSIRHAKRVEIVVGPMSALYGADAFSGVINIVTKGGRELNGASLSAAYGQYQTVDASVSVGRALDLLPFAKRPFLSRAALSLTAHRYDSAEPFLPGRYPGDYAWFNDQYQRGLMRSSPRAPPDAVTQVPVRPYDAGTGSRFLHARLDLGSLGLGYLRMSESHPSSTGVKPEFAVYAGEAAFQTSYSAVYGRHAYSSDDGRWKLGSSISYHQYEIDPQTRFINVFSLHKEAFKYASDRTLSVQEQATYQITDDSPLVLGLSYDDHSALVYTSDLPRPYDKDNSIASQGYFYPGSEVTDLNGRFLGVPQDIHFLQYQNVGLFTQLQAQGWERLQFTLGARYDRNSRYGDALNPRAGAVINPAGRLSLKLNYGEAFLAPSPFRTHLHFGNFTPVTNGLGQVTGLKSSFFTLPNPGLRPEKLREAEAELSCRVTERLWVSLGGYRAEISDFIRDDVIIGPGTFKGWPVDTIALSAVNRGSARSYGVTLRVDALARLGPWILKPDAAYSYSAGDLAGDVLPYTAKHSIRAGLELRRGRLTLSPRLIYRARTFSAIKDPAGNLQSSAPYALLNLFARYSHVVVGPARLSAFLSVTNLADIRYRNATLVSEVGFPAAPQDPIRVVGGIGLDF